MSSLVNPYSEAKVDPNQPHVRILVCHSCKSLEEIPDFQGPPEQDQLLTYKVAQHTPAANMPEHRANLFRVPEEQWDKEEVRTEIIHRLTLAAAPGEGAGLGTAMYDLKGNFADDAFKCWTQEHHRPTDPGKCDYHGKSKALYVDTKAERKAAGMDTSLSARPKHFLCDYCPVQSIVDQRKRDAAKMYDKQKWE